MKSKKTFRSQAVVNQNAETELMLEGDDDAVSLLQEKEIDNLAGKNPLFGMCDFFPLNVNKLCKFLNWLVSYPLYWYLCN